MISYLANKPVDRDLPCLAGPVRPIHGLLVHSGVPVAVIEDDGVRRSEVDA